MQRLERLSAGDHTTLVTDRGPAPMNIAAALVLEGTPSPDLDTVRGLLDERLVLIPRLRQRLVRAPVGFGRPVWVDDGHFTTDRHLSARTVASETELLGVVADLACARLQQDRPVWRACLVTGLPGDRSALVLMMHHVLADGLGGLAVLAALADDPGHPAQGRARPSAGTVPFPIPAPGLRVVALDAAQERLPRIRALPAALPGRPRAARARPRLSPATGGHHVTQPADRQPTHAVRDDGAVARGVGGRSPGGGAR